MRERIRNQRVQRSQKTKHHSSNSIHSASLLYYSTGGGIGGLSLPLSLVVATDVSLGGNEGAGLEVGTAGGGAGDASCGELGDQNASVASFEVSNSRGFEGPICADGSRASGRGRGQLNLFPPPLRKALCASPQLAMGCSNPPSSPGILFYTHCNALGHHPLNWGNPMIWECGYTPHLLRLLVVFSRGWVRIYEFSFTCSIVF